MVLTYLSVIWAFGNFDFHSVATRAPSSPGPITKSSEVVPVVSMSALVLISVFMYLVIVTCEVLILHGDPAI